MLAKHTKWSFYYRFILQFVKWPLDLIAGHQEYKLWGRRDSSDSFFCALCTETLQQDEPGLGKPVKSSFLNFSELCVHLCALQLNCVSFRIIYMVTLVFIKLEYYFPTGLFSCGTGRMAGNYTLAGYFLLSEIT